MSGPANVISLNGAVIESDRRAAFLQSVAGSYDLYVSRNGHDPDALVYVLCGITQDSYIAWDIRGESERGVGSVLSLAAVHCMAEAGKSRQGIDGA